jgi:hypothetical protein
VYKAQLHGMQTGRGELIFYCFYSVCKVYKAQLHGVQTVAVKLLSTRSPEQLVKFSNEITILKSCRNSNIVQFQVRMETLNPKNPEWQLCSSRCGWKP